MFVHLHCHSHYSFLRGVNPPEEIIAAAAEQKMPAVALTDTNGMYAAVPFYEKAKAAGVKPIVGVTLDVEGSGEWPFDYAQAKRVASGEKQEVKELKEAKDRSGVGMVLLAVDAAGYSNLCQLTTLRYLGALRLGQETFVEDESRPVTIEELAEHSAGVIALWPARVPVRQKTAGGRYTISDIFGDRLYIEVQHLSPGGGRVLREAERLGREMGIPLVATNNVHFVKPEEYLHHRAVNAVRVNGLLTTVSAPEITTGEAWFKPAEEMQRLFPDHPEWLRNTLEIAERCNLELELGKLILPEFPVPAKETAFSYLWKRSFDGAQKRYRPLRPEVLARLTRELEVIEKWGLAPYFLLVWDIVEEAKRRGIPAVARGSAASSMVLYCLGISCVCPLRWGLYFERFLNVQRGDCPDIDIDICGARRDELLDYVYERWGPEHVAMIGSFITMHARLAVREIAKVFGVPPGEVNFFTKRLPHRPVREILDAIRSLPQCRHLPVNDEPWKTILQVALRLDDAPRHLGIHPCGTVISARPLTHLVPLERAAKGIVVTQYDMNAIESLGLIKMDLLGQRGLTTMALALDNIEESGPSTTLRASEWLVTSEEFRKGEDGGVKPPLRGATDAARLPGYTGADRRRALRRQEGGAQPPLQEDEANGADSSLAIFSGSSLVTRHSPLGTSSVAADGVTPCPRARTIDFGAIPENDPATCDVIAAGRTMGVFQIESPGMRGLLREMKARTLEEIAMALALIRPGAAEYGSKELFLKRLRGKAPVEYAHESLKSILGDTLGVCIYQEQVMQIAQAVGNMSLAEADIVRRSAAKFSGQRERERLRGKFLKAAEQMGLRGAAREEAWMMVEKFAGFGFCKAHAATYADISYRMTYLKTHHTAEFLAAMCSAGAGFYHVSAYVEEAKRWGIEVRLPSVNRSRMEYTAEAGADGKRALRVGLVQVKGLRVETILALLREREARGAFRSLEDFLARVPAERDEIEALIKCGAFDDVCGMTRPAMLWRWNLLRTKKSAPSTTLPSKLGTSRASECQEKEEAKEVKEMEEVKAETHVTNSGFHVFSETRHSPLACPERSRRATRYLLPQIAAPEKMLFAEMEKEDAIGIAMEGLPAPEYTRERKLRYEREILEVCVSGHPLDFLPRNGETWSDELPRLHGKRVTLCGWVVTYRHVGTKNYRNMMFVTLEDQRGLFEVILFPDAYDKYGGLVYETQAIRVTGVVQEGEHVNGEMMERMGK